MCKDSFAFAVIQSLSPELTRAAGLWAAFTLCQHQAVSGSSVLALELATRGLMGDAVSLEAAVTLAHDESIPSFIRSAVYALTLDNYRLHVFHVFHEAASVYGWHFISNMLVDTLETGTCPLAA
jgi:hypothetical protein